MFGIGLRGPSAKRNYVISKCKKQKHSFPNFATHRKNDHTSFVVCFLSEHYSLGPQQCPIRRHRPGPSQSRTNPSPGSVLLTWAWRLITRADFSRTKGLRIISLHYNCVVRKFANIFYLLVWIHETVSAFCALWEHLLLICSLAKFGWCVLPVLFWKILGGILRVLGILIFVGSWG